MSMIKVVHVMADGEIRDSIEGITPPASCGCWEVMRSIARRMQCTETKTTERDTRGTTAQTAS